MTAGELTPDRERGGEMNPITLRWHGEVYDFSNVARVEGEPGDQTVTLHHKDGATSTLDSYPGEGLYERCTAWLSVAREETQDA